jgi:hypothetical protein
MSPKLVLAILVGYGVGIACSISALRRALALRRARAWRSTQGTVLESTTFVDEHQRTHFRVRYEFVGIQRMEGSTPRLSGDWFWNNAQQAAFVARYRPGAPVEVFFDPADPRRNCLDRTDASGVTALWVLALGGVALASLLVWLSAEGP